MKFGIFYEHQLPRRLWADAAKVTLSDPERHTPEATAKQ